MHRALDNTFHQAVDPLKVLSGSFCCQLGNPSWPLQLSIVFEGAGSARGSRCMVAMLVSTLQHANNILQQVV